MPDKPSDTVFRDVAGRLGGEHAAIRAVFDVEAAGRFYERDGSLPHRFEPHHFPRGYWGEIGFHPGRKTPWKASLRLSNSRRRKMFAAAEEIDREAAYRASSWGAPQIMGFNAGPAGYASAQDMVADMLEHPDNQVLAFFEFVDSQGLGAYLRAHDWYRFAYRYNGSGQAQTYARKLESAYRRRSGGASKVVLRVGDRGDSVSELQRLLAATGHLPGAGMVDGVFGPETRTAVLSFQESRGIAADGVVGAVTWGQIEAAAREAGTGAPVPETQETVADRNVGEMVEKGAPLVLGSGGAAGLLRGLGETGQVVVLSGIAVCAVIVVSAWAIPKIRGHS